MQIQIQISESAVTYIKKILEKNSGKSFRLSIKKTGCSGFSYFPSLQDAINKNDIPFVANKDLTIFVDGTWLHLLQGLQIDYIEEEKSGLKQKRLVFINPNEASRCGCGESFHIE